MDPALMATIWTLRQSLLEDVVASSVAECMAVALAVLGYYNSLRIQGWIGSLALHIEHEFFGLEGPTAKMAKKWGVADGPSVEDSCRRFAEQLIPLLEKTHKLTLRSGRVSSRAGGGRRVRCVRCVRRSRRPGRQFA